MYTSENVVQAMDVAADPESRGLILRWAEDVIGWAEKNMTDWERRYVVEAHRDRWA